MIDGGCVVEIDILELNTETSRIDCCQDLPT
jgi:hypothetical protein